jgi:hypothetical protein
MRLGIAFAEKKLCVYDRDVRLTGRKNGQRCVIHDIGVLGVILYTSNLYVCDE